jgi:uncharacterized protein (UPF0332 family)
VSAQLERGHEELRAARALLDAGFPSQAVSRAYFAGFHAASAATEELGEAPVTRPGIISAFARGVVAEDGLDHEAGRTLRKLFEDRQDVDYGLASAPAEEARAAIDGAEQLLSAVAGWIDGRGGRR